MDLWEQQESEGEREREVSWVRSIDKSKKAIRSDTPVLHLKAMHAKSCIYDWKNICLGGTNNKLDWYKED